MFENKAHVNPVKLYVNICPNGVLLTSRNQQALSQSHTNAMNNCDSKDNYWSILKWVKAFKNGPSKICGRKPLKIWSDMVFQNFLGSFLNTLTHMLVLILNPFHANVFTCVTTLQHSAAFFRILDIIESIGNIATKGVKMPKAAVPYYKLHNICLLTIYKYQWYSLIIRRC